MSFGSDSLFYCLSNSTKLEKLSRSIIFKDAATRLGWEWNYQSWDQGRRKNGAWRNIFSSFVLTAKVGTDGNLKKFLHFRDVSIVHFYHFYVLYQLYCQWRR